VRGGTFVHGLHGLEGKGKKGAVLAAGGKASCWRWG